MRKLIVSFLLLAAGISCRKPLFDPIPRWTHEQGRFAREQRLDAAGSGGASGSQDPSGEQLLAEYLTAFHYPEGFPWRDSVSTGAELVLYKNGEERLRVPVRGTPEADRHRVVEGELWTDACENGRMVVSCNGSERFSYPGEELYRGFLVLGGQVHTLGQRQGQEGFCYRIDGEEVFSSPTGTILGVPFDPDWPGGAFSVNGNEVCYVYALPVRRADALEWEYRVMQGATLLQTLRAGEVEQVYDIRVFQGDIYRCDRPAAAPSGIRILKGDKADPVGVYNNEAPHLCKLVPAGERLVVKGFTKVPGQERYNYWYRVDGHALHFASSSKPLLDFWHDENGKVAAVFLDPSREQRVHSIVLDKEVMELPPGSFRMGGSRCAAFSDELFSAALTDADSCVHRVFHARRDSVWVHTYSFNGCFTSIQIQ